MSGFDKISEHVAPSTIELWGISISESLLYAVMVSAGLILFPAIVRIFVIPKFTVVPKGFQIILEFFVNMFENMAAQTGHLAKFLAPYTFGVATFICFGVIFELFGVRSPLADINTTLALSLMTFFLINFFGIKRHGPMGRVKYFFKPVWFVGPFRIMSDLMVPISMSFRLFGSILSGMLTMEIVYVALSEGTRSLFGFALPLVFPALLAPIFNLFHALIQSYIFAMLTITFVAEASE